MRLKISAKEAVNRIDSLIGEGYFLSRWVVSDVGLSSDIKEAIKDQQDWFVSAREKLGKIFTYIAPVYKFLKAEKPKPVDVSSYSRESLVKELEEALDVLLEYFNELSAQSKSPVYYLSDEAQIWFFDYCCQLQPETNEAELCKFMFQFGVGEWKEMAEAHKAITGDEFDKKSKDKNAVQHALDGINGKTNESFQFPLIQKKKTVIALFIPSRLVLEPYRNKA